MKHVLSGVCVNCGREHAPAPDLTLCEACGGVLDIRYDYPAIAQKISRASLAGSSERSMWRYRALLPVKAENAISALRVGWSPLYRADRLAEQIGLRALWLKDDGQNPTASLKDRASAMAVVKAREAGAGTIACSSTGNAASSLAGNAAAEGLSTVIFVPSRAPEGKVAQLMMFGATVISVEGSYGDAFRLSKEAIDRWGWYNRNAAINPYLMEGKKTVAFEIAEQLGWEMPDYVAVSVGDGCTIAGVWKGFCDLHAVGLIDRKPKLLSVQAEGCCPIHRALQEDADLRPMEENTMADSIAVGMPRNPVKAMRAVRESGGLAVEVSDEEIYAAMRTLGREAGVFAEPAGAAATAGLIRAAKSGQIPPDASVCSIVTGSGLKDPAAAIRATGRPVALPPDLGRLADVLRERGVV